MLTSTSIGTVRRPSMIDIVLGDISRELFLRDHLGRTFLYLPGPTERFAHLLSWQELNRILDTQMFSSATLRMKKAGQDVSPESYLAAYTDYRKSGVATNVLTKVVTRELREGATLIINGIQKPCPAVAALADDLEEALEARINVNTYATLHESHGFPCHYDTHDVLVLQVQGRKHWQVFDRRPVTPFSHEPFERHERPGVSEPLWMGLLNPGDALYLPRGYWHFARPVGEPTIHLSVGIVSPTGLDLLNFVVGEMSAPDASELIRQNLPLAWPAPDQARHVESLRQGLMEALSRPDLLARFAKQWTIAGAMPPRARFGLPWSATEAGLPPTDDGTIHVTAPHALRAYDSPDSPDIVCLYVEGKPEVEFRRSVVPLCAYLTNSATVRVKDFLEEFSTDFEEATLRDFLRQLVVKGLIVIRTGYGVA